MSDKTAELPPSFAINRPRLDGKPIPLLPTLGTVYDGPLSASAQFRINGVDDYVNALHAGIDGAVRVQREVESSIVEAAKALGATPPQAMAYARLSFMPDPANYGLMQWPGIQPESLRKIAQENIAPQMIIRSRVSDLRRYSGLSTHPWKPGWEITLREAESTPSAKQKADIKSAQQFLLNCSRDGVYVDPQDRDAHMISPFGVFLCGMANDTLTFDGWSIWTDRDRMRRVRSFANLPAGLIRLAQPKQGFRGDPRVFAALVDETGTPAAAFTRDDMTWKVRNVRTDPAVLGYGWCYAADTEVLTDHGWKLFSAVDTETDRMATMALESRKFEWQKPVRKTWQSYVGKMYRIHSRSVDLIVTPNHRMVIKNTGVDRLRVMTAEEVFNARKGEKKNNNWQIPIVSTWEGTEIGARTFEEQRVERFGGSSIPVSMVGDDYCAFMGMYLSEGYVPNTSNGNNVYICQREKSKGYAPFKEVLTRILGSEPYFARGEMVVCRKVLAEHVKQFGKDCYSKRVPPEIMDATPRQIQIFLDYYLLGDGRTQEADRIEYKSKRRGRLGGVHRSITTTSRIMADQLQELIQKAGFAATIYTKKASAVRMVHDSLPRKDGTVLKYDYVSERHESYEICYKGSLTHGFSIEETTYSGDIGCATVPNGTLYVRRNGRAVWCGNSEVEICVRLVQAFQAAVDLNADTFSKSGIPNGILKLKGDFWQQEQVDALMREWTNMKRGVSKTWGMPVVAVPEDGDIEMMNFMDLKGQDVRYKDHMNMMMGCACVVYQYPVRRLGMFVSGHGKDNQPVPDESVEQSGVDDPGLPSLLQFIEEGVNEYLLWPAWPDLQFGFKNKNPKEDARSYAETTKARTWKESRAAVDLPSLTSVAPKWLKPMAEVLELCPEDSSKTAAFQTMAVKMLETMMGESGGADTASPGAPFPSLKDPAKTQEHGHRVGVRRDSAAEEANAGT